jgi:Protein of unknown function (DUF664)
MATWKQIEDAAPQFASQVRNRVLFHLVQEYARHVGHLDIVSELATGLTGE